MTIDPHPLSITAKGGNKIDKSTRIQPMVILLRINVRSSEKITSLKNKRFPKKPVEIYPQNRANILEPIL